MDIELVTDSARIELEHPIGDVHPDLVALTLLTFVAPWARDQITLDRGVSQSFADAAQQGLGIAIRPIDSTLEPRTEGQRLGLMYSGGPDCMAAQVLLDIEMPLFHFRRIPHRWVPNRATNFKPGTQEALVRQVQKRGAELHVARSDLEFLCRPFPTFPHWAALTVGAVLSADQHDLGGVVTGRNISGIYLGWGRRYTEMGENESGWEAVYSAAGLRLLHPLAGASDVLSKKLARSHPFHDLARSCVAGSMQGPCLACKKCLVTELMNAVVVQRPLPDAVIRGVSSNPVLAQALAKGPPYPSQHLLAYTLPRVPDVDNTFLKVVKQALPSDLAATSWMDRYYRPALVQRLPQDIVARLESKIEDSAAFMTPAEESMVKAWST